MGGGRVAPGGGLRQEAQLLTLRRVEGEPAGMSTFALLYPSPTLAELGDPLAIARDLGAAAHRSSGT
jgi:hypothetical protein